MPDTGGKKKKPVKKATPKKAMPTKKQRKGGYGGS